MCKLSNKAIFLFSTAIIFVLLIIYYMWADRVTPSTNDAYFEAHVVQIAPRVAARVTSVDVVNNQAVKKDQLLFTLNNEQFLHTLNQRKAELLEAQEQVKQYESQVSAAKAALKQAQAELAYDTKEYDAYKSLVSENAVSVLKFQQLAAKYRESQQAVTQAQYQVLNIQNMLEKTDGKYAQVAQAQANLNQAKQDYGDCWVRAPFDGRVSYLRVSEGMYAKQGTPVIALIDTRRWWVIARIKENNLDRIRPGQTVDISAEMYPDQVFTGAVQSIGYGVNLDQQIPEVWMPYIPVTRNWVRLAQRFPVQISINPEKAYPLRVGATAIVTIYTEPSGFLVWVGKMRQHIFSWLQNFY